MTANGAAENTSLPALAGVLLVTAMALAAVLPPALLAVYVVLGGAMAAVIALVQFRSALFDPWFLAIFGCFVVAAVFCLMGTLPVSQKSDIQLEFLKYGVYAAGFLVGFVGLRTEQAGRRFVGIVLTLILILFVVFAVKGGAILRVDQSWPVYPPDQNNSVAIIVVLAAGVVSTTPIRSRMLLLFVMAVFVAFFESRIGLVIVVAMMVLQVRVAPKLTLVVLTASVGIWAYMSYGPLNPQTKLIFAAQDIVTKTASALPPSMQRHAETLPPSVTTPTAALPANRPLLEIGTESDISRFGIYRRALEIAVEQFPNLLGMGDVAVIERLNDPPLARNVVFQHTHNFLLQGYLAYGLIATLSLVAALVIMVVLAVRRRAWGLLASLVMIAGLGMIEALSSDIRVLTIISIFLGGQVASLIGSPGFKVDVPTGARDN